MAVAKNKNHIGKKIKRIRAYKGITQQALADNIGKTRTLISYLESSGNINKYTLEEIAETLGVTISEIEELQIETADFTKTNRIQKKTLLPPPLNMLEQLKAENNFLKTTINKQWEIIAELTRKVNSSKKG